MNIKTNKIFIGGLRKDTKEEELFNFLSQYVKIENIIFRKKTGYKQLCIGYAIIEIPEEEANNLYKESLFFKGRFIKCIPHLEGSELKSHLSKLNSRRILVQNLPMDVTDQKLINYFKKFGLVENAYISNHHSRADMDNIRGYVIFKNNGFASEALKIPKKKFERQ